MDELTDAARRLTNDDYNVGWVCALPKEQTMAIAMLDERHSNVDFSKSPNDTNTYSFGSIGRHNIVIVCLPQGRVGTNSAATATTNMVNTFPSIKIGLMVGIGGGIPPKVRRGDVVVSSPAGQFPGVVQWDFGKTTENGFKRIGALNSPPTSLLTAISTLRSEHELSEPKMSEYLNELRTKHPRLVQKYLNSESLQDLLFRADYVHVTKSAAVQAGYYDDDGDDVEEESCRFCDRTKIVKRKPRDAIVHYGLIASGNQVIRDAAFRGEVNRALGGEVLCFEMEAAGLMNDFPCVVIRGICDYADSHKNDEWQEYAAAVAAAFAKELLGYVQPSDVMKERTAKELLSHVGEIKDMTKAIKRQLEDGKDREVLDWLTKYDYGRQQSEFIKTRQSKTCQWFFDSEEYKTWLDEAGQTLFCPGIPGAGKTILTATVVNDLTNTRFRNHPSVGIAYVYFNYNKTNEQKADDVLASLLKQLAATPAGISPSLKTLHDHHKKQQTRPSLEELKMTLSDIVGTYSRVFIIIDAVDECQGPDGRLRRLLAELFGLQATHATNIFATSRFITDITEQFKHNLSLEIRARQDDVKEYLQGQIMELQSSIIKKKPDLREEITENISEAVDGMFLLARLYLDSLRDKLTVCAIRDALQGFKSKAQASDVNNEKVLAYAYDQTMERIEPREQGFRDLALKVLSWISCARRPLTTLELRHALAVEPGDQEVNEDKLPQIEDMVSVCAGLVTVGAGDVIRLVHYTTQEYFDKKGSIWFANAESNMSEVCVTYLSFKPFNGSSVSLPFEDRSRAYPLYDYASRNWGHHAAKTSPPSKTIMRFLRGRNSIDTSHASLYEKHQHLRLFMLTNKLPRALHLTAYFGLYEATRILLLDHDDPDVGDFCARTPLSYAADKGHETVVRLLLDNRADVHGAVNIGDEVPYLDKNLTPLLHATVGGHLAVVKLLLERGARADWGGIYRGVDDWKGRSDDTPLSYAARLGHEAVVGLLLKARANIESKGRHGQTPLSYAAAEGRAAVVSLLLNAGSNIESKDVEGRTPLSYAAAGGHEEVAKALLQMGADVDSQDEKSRTPLSRAAEKGFEPVIRILLRHQADPEIKDSFGKTPLLHAIKNGHRSIIKLLLENGADIQSTDSKGQTPVMYASELAYLGSLRPRIARLSPPNYQYIMKLLLDKGANTEDKDQDGQTLLGRAVQRHSRVIVKLLLERGANIESQDIHGQTPLSLALKWGNQDMVNLLSQRQGAETNVP